MGGKILEYEAKDDSVEKIADDFEQEISLLNFLVAYLQCFL